MNNESKILKLSPTGFMLDENGLKVTAPQGWEFLPAGDAGLTRKVSSMGEYWKVVFQKGRRTMSKGIWAPKENIQIARGQVQTMREDPQYQKKMAAALIRREKKQEEYVEDFQGAVRSFLDFAYIYKEEEKHLAELVTAHATPVGSGTVARTSMIPIQERASRAVIAWMRHQTTAYDDMQIAHIKGERRKVRKMLAQRSLQILKAYREGKAVSSDCPLQAALKK